MLWYTDFVAWWNLRIKRFTIYDIKLLQGAAMGLALVIVKIIPEIMSLSVWWFVAYALLCALRPMWLVFGSQPAARAG